MPLDTTIRNWLHKDWSAANRQLRRSCYVLWVVENFIIFLLSSPKRNKISFVRFPFYCSIEHLKWFWRIKRVLLWLSEIDFDLFLFTWLRQWFKCHTMISHRESWMKYQFKLLRMDIQFRFTQSVVAISCCNKSLHATNIAWILPKPNPFTNIRSTHQHSDRITNWNITDVITNID